MFKAQSVTCWCVINLSPSCCQEKACQTVLFLMEFILIFIFWMIIKNTSTTHLLASWYILCSFLMRNISFFNSHNCKSLFYLWYLKFGAPFSDAPLSCLFFLLIPIATNHSTRPSQQTIWNVLSEDRNRENKAFQSRAYVIKWETLFLRASFKCFSLGWQSCLVLGPISLLPIQGCPTCSPCGPGWLWMWLKPKL